ncbi:Amino acid adenylation domain-containing protein [uncultured delta proteobacterium]|uniref:Amino acid adenylation domain-containing protein n=1 Tax=uncultured delta proteobacterium TaxID=34034 RepID=A0A212JWU7_9DELT|nr:Amino acid adenylation domain-containing protein [uncultured delta proteobacterium]
MRLVQMTEYLDRTVAAHPDRPAVHDGDSCLTFSALYDRVLSLALQLSEALEGRTGRIVAVFLPKSTDSIIVDLAIAYSGNAYMNMDVKSPRQRIHNILSQVQPDLMVTHKNTAHSLPPLSSLACPLFELDEYSAEPFDAVDRQKAKNLRGSCIDTDPFCVINTSGSTGTPKAVVLHHLSFIDFTEAVIGEGLVGEAEVVGSLSPLVFDIYSFELCMLMAKGSTIVILPESLAAFPVRLLERMASCKVTFIFWVPTIMVNIANLDLLQSVPLPDLKMIWFAGEVFPTAKCNYWRKHLPDAVFANFYGPIEITLDCLFHVLSREFQDHEPIPIGKPFRNTAVLVLDADNLPVQEGEEGELCIRGSSLAMGYYNNEEKTAAAFVQNPLNRSYPEIIYRTGDIVAANEFGELVYKGRKDTLIKHGGYRIELGEIEHVAVNTLGLVPNCCAVYSPEARRITLFYEADAPLPEKNLRERLGSVLPRYMVPAAYVHVPQMPRNTNGKIDRLFLRKSLEEV